MTMARYVYDLPETVYHAGPELSASGAKTLLDNPAKYAHQCAHPKPATDSMDAGSVAHRLTLHAGAGITIVDAYDWRRRADQERRDQAREAGQVVIHRGQLAAAARIARAVRSHPLAGDLLAEGNPEVSIYWDEQVTIGWRTHTVPCRARADWMRDGLIIDLKTTSRGTSEKALQRTVIDYGYHISAAHYLRGVEQVSGARPEFWFIFVDTEPPHTVSVHRLDDRLLAVGEERILTAYETWAACDASGSWPPPWSMDDVHTITAPHWL